jgi:FkbM family methyltransferase
MFLSNKIQGLKEMLSFDNYFQLVLSRLLFRGTSIVIYRKNGCEFLVDQHAGDVNGIRSILTTKMYSQFFKHLSALQTRSLNVLDLGSHVGGFPLLLHLSGFKIHRLSCVELNPSTYLRMCFNVANNLKCEFLPVQGAVCGERKQFALNFGRGSTSDSIFTAKNSQQATDGLTPRMVDGWTFDELSERAFPNDDVIDLCKIDVEGAEYDIFLSSSAHESICRCAYLVMEIHPHKTHSVSQIIDRLAAYGIRPVERDSQDSVYLFKNEELASRRSPSIKGSAIA